MELVKAKFRLKNMFPMFANAINTNIEFGIMHICNNCKDGCIFSVLSCREAECLVFQVKKDFLRN